METENLMLEFGNWGLAGFSKVLVDNFLSNEFTVVYIVRNYLLTQAS